MNKKSLLAAVLTFFLALNGYAQNDSGALPQEEDPEAQLRAFLDGFSWQTEGEGELGEWATLEIPNGYAFLSGGQASDLIQALGNPRSEYDGLISRGDLDWFVIFQFDPSGYVKDDEKDELDADKLLEDLREIQVYQNEYRQEQGMEPMYIEGWEVEPRYNERTNNLEWGLLVRSQSSTSPSVNYRTKLLGREGLMDVTLVCSPDQLDYVLPDYQDLLLGHVYKEGKSYADYRQGDKIAEYGLTALIAGGAMYGAAKLGLLGSIMAFGKKFLKFIIAGAVAIGMAFKKFFARMAGREIREDTNQ
ncbi:DUF2167 domain-containing protein [Pelagicoccus mobilis]|uniref:DUF2167 domain-containing protein n=1 Tax=Pelagicoccus mobilis TaxID=415221 RepID=A0A934VPK0_9BACT|nr:DUF2167 domain-containing protein [Pelagicoccus mobilis]MBK1877372.1 DUF2167 domain-containing protein [Pelagicoccus mobilis]